MRGCDLREARKRRGLTQQQASRLLRVTQGYLSMLESEMRHVPEHLIDSFLDTYELSPLALPLQKPYSWQPLDMNRLATELGALGHPGFSYLPGTPSRNPAEVLLAALTKDELEARIAESLPWLALAYSNMDWDWVVREAKVNDVTNRLGFTITLAREMADQRQDAVTAQRLKVVESKLHRSLLAREDTFCQEHMTHAERRWLRGKSSTEARRWNVLSDLSPQHLIHATNV